MYVWSTKAQTWRCLTVVPTPPRHAPMQPGKRMCGPEVGHTMGPSRARASARSPDSESMVLSAVPHLWAITSLSSSSHRAGGPPEHCGREGVDQMSLIQDRARAGRTWEQVGPDAELSAAAGGAGAQERLRGRVEMVRLRRTAACVPALQYGPGGVTELLGPLVCKAGGTVPIPKTQHRGSTQ